MFTLEQKKVAKVAAAGDLVPLKKAFFSELQIQAQQTVAKNLNINNMQPIDAGGLGDFPWFWNNSGPFNLKTFNWLNNVFRFNQDGYVETDQTSFLTAYYNTILSIGYVLSPAEQDALNKAINQNAAIVNTMISDFISAFGPIPTTTPNTPIAKLNYITAQVISWGASNLTLSTLRSSLDPIALLPNRPLGSETVINDLMTYLAATSSVENIQAAVLVRNNQLADIRRNIQPVPSSAVQGWMQTVDDAGQNTIVPQINIAESIATIQNGLFPANGSGNTFSVSMSVKKVDEQTVQVTADGGIGGSGWINWFQISGGVQASYNMFSFDQQVQNLKVKITFNGVTRVTPAPAAYDASSRTGWWMPDIIRQAVNFDPKSDGYRFNLPPVYNFGNNGTFGLVSALIICQQPTFELTYTKADYSKFQQVFQQRSSWGISFLGIPLAGGSQSYYHSELHEDSTSGTITIKMSPPVGPAPVPTLDQLAYVAGVSINWPAA